MFHLKLHLQILLGKRNSPPKTAPVGRTTARTENGHGRLRRKDDRVLTLNKVSYFHLCFEMKRQQLVEKLYNNSHLNWPIRLNVL